MARIVLMVNEDRLWLGTWIQQQLMDSNNSWIIITSNTCNNVLTINLQSTHLLDCKCEAIDLASCSHGFFRHTLNRHRSDAVMAHHRHISSMWLNIRDCLGKCRTHTHNRVMKLVLLKNGSKNIGKWCYCNWNSYLNLYESVKRLTIEFSCSAFDGPIIIAMIMHSAFTIEQQAIFTRFQC